MAQTNFRLNKHYSSSTESLQPSIGIKTKGSSILNQRVFRKGMVTMSFIMAAGGAVISLGSPQVAYAHDSKGNSNTVYTLCISGGEADMNKKVQNIYSSDSVSDFVYTAAPKEIFDLPDDFSIQDDLRIPIGRYVADQVSDISYKAKPKSVFEL